MNDFIFVFLLFVSHITNKVCTKFNDIIIDTKNLFQESELSKQSREILSISPDPVKHCQTYKELGCSHVDRYLCDTRTCSEFTRKP